MNELELSPATVRLARAIRFAFVALMLCLSYFSIRASLNIGFVHAVFHDMLGGKPLPWITEFVFTTRFVFITSSTLIPLLSIATLFSRRLIGSFYFLGVLSLVAVAEFVLLLQALSTPLAVIAANMQGG